MAAKSFRRPPIVAVLGHVDHGKTSLISKIKNLDLTRKETGGISQHLGAYQIDFQGKKITFIDTPGHVAFSQMRSRGARVADLVVLVVAADEGVKPQTVESLKHIQAAKIPFLVAINKVDLPGINLNQVKKNLVENNILVEGFGGKIVAVPVSAKSGQGIDELLEMILLMAEMEELKADPQSSLEAVVIESRVDQGKGPVATVLIRNGSLKVGQTIGVGDQAVKAKAMFGPRDQKLTQVFPGEVVELLGFTSVPAVGSLVGSSTQKEKTPPLAKTKIKTDKTKEIKAAKGKKLKVILKTDVLGTLEAILGSLSPEVEVVETGVGNINQSDVLLAETTQAEVIGFNVKASAVIKKLAQTEKVKIKTYKIIYELLEDLEKKILKILEPTIDEETLGKAEIIAEFEVKKQRVAGCRVLEGRIDKEARVHLQRGEKILADGRIKSMKKDKEAREQVKKGEEFGAILSLSVDFTLGDVLISFRSKKKENE